MKLKSLAGTAGAALIFALLASPAFPNIVDCVSGNLSTVDGTTCDIGNLQFTFTGLMSGNSSGSPWTDSDFNFTVLSNGFELSGPGPQTITAPLNGQFEGNAYDYGQLDYSVTDLTDAIIGLEISGGSLSASGNFGVSTAENSAEICGTINPCSQAYGAYNEVDDFYGPIYSYLGVTSGSGAIISATGDAVPFDLSATNGNSASINSTATSFTFITGPTPIPEPSLLTLLSIGLLGLGYATKRNPHR
jgi:hypothetical protein